MLPHPDADHDEDAGRRARARHRGEWRWFALVATVLLGFTLWGGVGAEIAARTWRPVPAVVTATTVERGGLAKRKWRPIVRFAYEVDGRRHEARRLGWFTKHYRTREQAEARMGEYAPGARVTAWVHPRDPGQAMLEAERGVWFVGPSLVGAMLALLAVGIHRRRPRG